MRKYFKILNIALTLLFLSSTGSFGASSNLQVTEVNGTEVKYFVPPALTPATVDNGKTIQNAVNAVVYIADPAAPSTPIQALSADNTDNSPVQPAATTADFSILYIAAGDTDKWGQKCIEFPAEAKAAFEAAVAIWAQRIHSSVPITLRAGWAELDGNTLGYSGGGSIHRDFTGAPKPGIYYMATLANALAGIDLDTENDDIHLTFNSNYAWYFGTDGNTPSGRFDFESVVLHEIGHGLGFSGSADYDSSTGNGSWFNAPNPEIFDSFTEDGNGISLTNSNAYPNDTKILGNAFTSGSVWFNGGWSVARNGGERVRLYAPSNWHPGSSFSHLDYNTFSGTENSLMVYAISSGYSIHSPGPVMEGMLVDMGWIISTPDTPESFSAVAIDKFNINLTWTPDSYKDDVMIVWNTNNIFGIPTGVYSPGDTVEGGGQVLYMGNETDFTHQWLKMGTRYYYRIYSILPNGSYSFDLAASAFTPSVLTEDFENDGNIPDGWSQQYVVSYTKWQYQTGGRYGRPDTAHSGKYNAVLYSDNSNDNITRLITPEIDFGSATQNVQLAFWHCMQKWGSDLDSLKILYKTSPSDEWKTLAIYKDEVSVWTKHTIALPEANNSYYIAFEGNAKYGYGVCIDDVAITGEEPIPIYTIGVSSTGNGTITPAESVSIEAGTTTNFIITAAEHYYISSIKTNDVNITGSPYTNENFSTTNFIWNNIEGDGTVKAEFSIIPIKTGISGIAKSTNGFVIEWGTSNGWQYLCESADSLTGNPVIWNTVGDGWQLSTGGIMRVVDTNADQYTHRVYRIKAK